MRLVDLGESGINDLLVQLFLFFKAKDLGGFGRQYVDNAVEHCVVEVRVVDGNRLYLLTEHPGQRNRGLKSGEGLGAAVDGDDDPLRRIMTKRMRIADYQGIDPNASHDPVSDAAHHAVLDGAHSERP